VVAFNATRFKTNFMKVSQLIQKVTIYADSMVASFLAGRGVDCSGEALNAYSGKSVYETVLTMSHLSNYKQQFKS
jgi:predicted small integral membrane protein